MLPRADLPHIPLILAVDVHYEGDWATAAGVLFEGWDACAATQTALAHLANVADYESGQFYKRELPGILALLARLTAPPQVIVIDGYVCLGHSQKPGLGKHLFDALNGRMPIIGVAKTRYQGTPTSAEVRRGRSQRPLYITAVGLEQAAAKTAVQQMCGNGRLPRLLKQVDQLCRSQGDGHG